MGLNLRAFVVHSIKRNGETKDAKKLPIYRLVIARAGIDPDARVLNPAYASLFASIHQEELAKPEQDRDCFFEFSCSLQFTVPPDVQPYVSSLQPGQIADDLWDRLAKWKKSAFFNPETWPRRKSLADPPVPLPVGCRLTSHGNQPAVKTIGFEIDTGVTVEWREYCDDNVLSRDPSVGPAFYVLRNDVYSEWAFLQRDPKKIFARAEPTLPALLKLEEAIIAQDQKAASTQGTKYRREHGAAALLKIRAEIAAMRARG